jgi:hypothetical protein
MGFQSFIIAYISNKTFGIGTIDVISLVFFPLNKGRVAKFGSDRTERETNNNRIEPSRKRIETH